jgi:DNA repair protein RadA
LHRAEFVGRGTLSERQQKLNAIMHRLKRVAEIYNVAVIITNQVQATPDTFFGDPTKAAGGNIIGHASTYRIYLRKAGQERKAIMIDSPMHPYGDTNFMIVEAGITDPTEKKPTKFVRGPSRNSDKEREDEEE